MLHGLPKATQAPPLRPFQTLKIFDRKLQLSPNLGWQRKGAGELASRAVSSTSSRPAKSVSTSNLRALAQKPLDGLPSLDYDGGRLTKYPTVVQEAYDNMQRYRDCVVLTKVGGFYELYFDQARELGPQLNLKVAEKKTVAGSVPMVAAPCIPSAMSLML